MAGLAFEQSNDVLAVVAVTATNASRMRSRQHGGDLVAEQVSLLLSKGEELMDGLVRFATRQRGPVSS